MVLCYWAAHLVGTLVCGPRWLRRAEGFNRVFAAFARLAPMARQGGSWRLGLPGWRLLRGPAPPIGVALLYLAMLAVGSFDGLNETFLWIAALGLNPLEIPGRSAVVLPNLLGLARAVPALATIFAVTVRLGLALARVSSVAAFRSFAPAILPIAFGYHLAHYLPSTLVDGQYLVLALNDPLGRGADLFGLGHVHVTTGFFNTLATVRVIWLSQAAAVVLGHVLAVLLGHALALHLTRDQRAAALSQVPLAIFMIAYTLFGLWLLAAPRGV
jgi:hypothetical protein